MKAAIYPGSFDPMTLGHLDVIRRASKMFDTLIVSVLDNKAKNALFSVEERVSILKEATKDLPNVQVDSFQGLLIDYARQKDIHVSVRGLRAITDFEYELQMAQTNRVIAPQVIQWNAGYGISDYKSGICLFKFFQCKGNCFFSWRYLPVCS